MGCVHKNHLLYLVISVPSNSTRFLPVSDDLLMLVHGTVNFDSNWFYLLALD